MSIGRVVVVGLLVVTLAVPVLAGSGSVPDGGYRIFYSGDEDREPESPVDSPPDRSEVDPAGYARVGDLCFRTTNPSLTVNGTTLWEYRRRQLAAIERSRERVIRFPHSPSGRSSGGPLPLITDAHITYMGINGGAEPHLGWLLRGDFPIFVGRSGEVLNVVDYRFHPEHVPPQYRDHCRTNYRTVTQELFGGNTTVYLDGDRTCWRYRFPISTDRKVRFDGETIASGDDRALRFRNLSAGEGLLVLEATITVEIIEITKTYDWDPTTKPATETADGSWDLVNRSRGVVGKSSVAVADQRRAHVTGNGALSIEQTIIQQGNRSHVVLSLSGPNATTHVGRSQLGRRRLLSSIELTNKTSIATSWATYSMRRYDRAIEIGPDGIARTIDPPHVLQMKLMGLYQRPTVDTLQSGGSNTTRVIDFEAIPVFPGTRPHPANVNFPVRRPVVFQTIVIADAPNPVRAVQTIHGREIPVEVDKRVPYRRPNISIRPMDGGRVAIHVTDPVTGDPLAGRNVTVFGGRPKRARTAANGTLIVTPRSVHLRVRTARDSLTQPGDIFYDRATASRTFLPIDSVVARLARFILACVYASPLLLLLVLIRNRELLV